MRVVVNCVAKGNAEVKQEPSRCVVPDFVRRFWWVATVSGRNQERSHAEDTTRHANRIATPLLPHPRYTYSPAISATDLKGSRTIICSPSFYTVHRSSTFPSRPRRAADPHQLIARGISNNKSLNEGITRSRTSTTESISKSNFAVDSQ